MLIRREKKYYARKRSAFSGTFRKQLQVNMRYSHQNSLSQCLRPKDFEIAHFRHFAAGFHEAGKFVALLALL